MRKKAIQKEIIPVSYQRDILLYRGKIVFNSSVYYHNSMGKSKCFFLAAAMPAFQALSALKNLKTTRFSYKTTRPD